MSTAGSPGAAPSPSDAATRLREAAFVRLFATPDGDALAGAGLLAGALDGPFQVRTAVSAGGVSREDDALTITCGLDGGDLSLTGLVGPVAHAAAAELGGGDPSLALAGVVAAGNTPGRHAGLCEAAGAESGPGVGVPTDDVADGLAHTTLVHAAFSGDPEAAAQALAGKERDGRTLASLVALSAVRDAPPRAATAVERALAPHRAGPLHTLEGYADVLDAAARERPGAGVALALGGDAEPALSAWREHAAHVHPAARGEVTRHDGLAVVAATGGPGRLGTVARLVRDYRTQEPAAAAVDDGAVAVAAGEDVEQPARAAAEATDCTVTVRNRTAHAVGDGEAYAAALRRAL
jgi:hypothetical protein